MAGFKTNIRRALLDRTPQQVVYALGLRGRAAREISRRLADGLSMTAREMAAAVLYPMDFMSREPLTHGDPAFAGRVAWRLNRRAALADEKVRSGSTKSEIQRRVDPQYSIAAAELFGNRELDYLASQHGSPVQAVIDYVGALAGKVAPAVIKRAFPEGYLFKDYFFWIDFPLRDAYVFKFADEYYFHFYHSDQAARFTVKSKNYGRLLLKALNAIAAHHLGPSGVQVDKLQVVTSRNCNDQCRFCPFVLDNSVVRALSNEQADAVVEFLNGNPAIDTLLFVGNGEPMLNYRAILRILRASRHLKSVAIYSNGFWGSRADQYLPELSRACPEARIVLNLAVDVQHSAENIRRTRLLVTRYEEFVQAGRLPNVEMHLRGLLFDGQILEHDPIHAILAELGIDAAEQTRILGQFVSGNQVVLPTISGVLRISYNNLKTDSDVRATPENLQVWFPTLVVTDEGVLGIGSYEVASPLVELGDFFPVAAAYPLARNNILLHYLESPRLTETIHALGREFPEIWQRTYLATDILRNLFQTPEVGLAFVLMLYQAEVQRDPVQNKCLGVVLEELGIAADMPAAQVKQRVSALALPNVPAEVTRKKNWWFEAEGQAAISDVVPNRWLPFWIPAERARARELTGAFVADDVIEPLQGFLRDKYGVTDQPAEVLSISVTGSSIYNFSKKVPVGDVDYIATVAQPGITDVFTIPGTNSSVWVVSEECLRGESTRALHVDLAINIEHGLVLHGQNPVTHPVPIVERVKMAYFYANLIERIIFDRNYRDSLKRMIELKRILLQVKHCLRTDLPGSRVPFMAASDVEHFGEIREAFEGRFSDFEFDQVAAWEEFDAVVEQGDQYLTNRRIQDLWTEAAVLKGKLFDFIARVESFSSGGRLYQESRQHVYAVFNSRRADVPAEDHAMYLRRFSDDYSVVLTLAGNTPHRSVGDAIVSVLAGADSPFNAGQTTAIQRALRLNPHLQLIDYSKVKSRTIFDQANGGHVGEARSVDFNLDGRFLYTAGYDRTVRLMDTVGGRSLHLFGEYDDVVQNVRVSLDGGLVTVAGRDGVVRLLEAQSAEELFTLDASNGGHNGWVMWAEVSADHKYLISADWNGLVMVTDIRSGRVVHVFDRSNDGPKSHARVAAFNSRENMLLTAGDDAVLRFFSWPLCQSHWNFSRDEGGHLDSILFAAFNHRGDRAVSTGDDGRVIITDVRKRKVVMSLTAENLGRAVGRTRAADFSPRDDHLAVVDSNGMLWIVKLENMAPVLTLGPTVPELGRKNGATSVRFSRDGARLALSRASGIVEVLEFERKKEG